jgi:hypothetical protein
MTDNEIIKALERCGQHRECCYCNSVEECGNKIILTASTLDLLERKNAELDGKIGTIMKQQKEIERLKDDKNRLEKMMDNLCKELDAEKIKNF